MIKVSSIDVFNIVSSILEDMGIETNDVTEDTCLEANLAMDSQEVVELQFAREKQYHIKFPAGFLNRDLSIRDLIEKLQYLINCFERHGNS